MSCESKSMCGMLTWWFLFALLLSSGRSDQRTLRSWVNPGCNALCDGKNISTVYLRADGPNDTIHYLWDFIGTPSLLLAVTPTTAWANISWQDYIMRKENSLTFDQEPTYTFGVIIGKVIEFDDVNDTGVIHTTNSTNVSVLRAEFFRWVRKAASQNGLDMEGNSYNDTAKNITRNGSIKISLRGFDSLDHSALVPHMLHTENSTQIDIILDHFNTTASFKKSRFAIELLVVGGGNPDAPMLIEPKKSLDDEHTPGVFEIIEVKPPPFEGANYEESSIGGYLQWRPVSYVTEIRDITNSTETIQYPSVKVSNRTKAVENSMLYCYYGRGIEDLLVQKITVSLGITGDGFYSRTNYSTWTFMVGYGDPPEEQFSYLVIMIISIGLGLPLLIMFAAALYVCCPKRLKRHSEMSINR